MPPLWMDAVSGASRAFSGDDPGNFSRIFILFVTVVNILCNGDAYGHPCVHGNTGNDVSSNGNR